MNIATAVYSGATGPRRSAQFPAITMPMTPVARGPANASAYSRSPPRSALTVGITVVTARDSNAPRNTSAHAPIVIHTCWLLMMRAAAASGVAACSVSEVMMTTVEPQVRLRSRTDLAMPQRTGRKCVGVGTCASWRIPSGAPVRSSRSIRVMVSERCPATSILPSWTRW